MPLAHVHGQTERARQAFHECRVAMGCSSAHSVVQKANRQTQSQGLGNLVNDPQETHAVTTPRDRDHPNATHASVEPALDPSGNPIDPTVSHRTIDRFVLARWIAPRSL